MKKSLSEIEKLMIEAGVNSRPLHQQPELNICNTGEAETAAGKLDPPFSYFGGKRKIAYEVWRRFGADIENYIEPCAGGLAVLLNRPPSTALLDRQSPERVNDRDCLIANFWRAVKYAEPSKFAELCDYPYAASELVAWHYELIMRRGELQDKLERGVYYYDLETAARWVWGSKGWIGSGFANPRSYVADKAPRAVIPGWPGGSAVEYITRLYNRLRNVLVLHGDWKDAVGSSTATLDQGTTAVFFDPPYPNQGRAGCYAEDDGRVADDILNWALEHGKDKRFRIAFCGYRRHHDHLIPANWGKPLEWNANGGYANQGDGRGRDNAREEMVWFSPGCLKV